MHHAEKTVVVELHQRKAEITVLQQNGILVVKIATEMSMNKAMAAGRVRRPRMTIAPQTVSTVATNGPKKSG
jgi:hypothetical protein